MNVVKFISLKLKEEMNHFHLLDALIDDDDDYSLLLHWELLPKTLKRRSLG
jgi:hypothetical protein